MLSSWVVSNRLTLTRTYILPQLLEITTRFFRQSSSGPSSFLVFFMMAGLILHFCRSTNNTLLFDVVTQFYPLFYAFPTTFLYILVIFSMNKQANQYSQVYVKIFTLSSSLNLICWWLDFLQLHILGFWPFCPFFTSFSEQYWLSILYFFVSCVPLACLLCSTTISVYQMCSIVFPTRSEHDFRHNIRKIYLFLAVVPMICCSHSFISRVKMMPLSSSRIYLRLLHNLTGLDFLTVAFVNGVVAIVCFVVICITSLISIVRYCQIRKKNNGAVKLRLFIINLYICLSIVLYIVLQLFMFHARVIADNNISLTATAFSYKSLVSDLCYLPIPWFVLLVNRKLRPSLRDLFGTSKVTVIGQNPTTSTGNKF